MCISNLFSECLYWLKHSVTCEDFKFQKICLSHVLHRLVSTRHILVLQDLFWEAFCISLPLVRSRVSRPVLMVCPAFLVSRGTVCSRSTRRQSRHKSRRCRRSHQLSRRRDSRCLFREGRNGQRVCVSLSRVCFASCWKVVALGRACGDKYGRITSLTKAIFFFFFTFCCKILLVFFIRLLFISSWHAAEDDVLPWPLCDKNGKEVFPSCPSCVCAEISW